MRSCTRRPSGWSANAFTTAVSRPNQRSKPRDTLYSPPPSQTRKVRVVAIRLSPGSKRSMTSPRLTRSHRQPAFGLIVSGGIERFACRRLGAGAAKRYATILRWLRKIGIGESHLTGNLFTSGRQDRANLALLL